MSWKPLGKRNSGSGVSVTVTKKNEIDIRIADPPLSQLGWKVKQDVSVSIGTGSDEGWIRITSGGSRRLNRYRYNTESVRLRFTYNGIRPAEVIKGQRTVLDYKIVSEGLEINFGKKTPVQDRKVMLVVDALRANRDEVRPLDDGELMVNGQRMTYGQAVDRVRRIAT